MALTTTTTATTMIPELWSALTADYREAGLVRANFLDRRYEAEMSGKAYDTIHIQGFSTFDSESGTHADDLGVGGSLTYDAANYQTQVDLVIDTHAYQAFDVETEAELMTNVRQFDNLAKAAAYSVNHRVDDDCAGLIDDDAGSQAVGALGTGLTISEITRGVQYLDDALCPETDRFFFYSHAEKRNLQNLEKLVNRDYEGSIGNIDPNAMKDAYQGRHYTLDWYANSNTEGTNAAGHDNGMWHREFAAIAIIDNMRVATDYEIDTDSDKFAIHVIYGIKVVRTDHVVFARGL